MKEIFDWSNPQKIFVVAVIFILLLIVWAVWRRSIKNLKCLPPLEFFDENVVVTLLSCCDEGFKCTFCFKGVCYDGIVYLDDSDLGFNIGDELRARVINYSDGKICLTPLEWPETVSTQNAIITGKDNGRWYCVSNFMGYQKRYLVEESDPPFDFNVGARFEIVGFEGNMVTLKVDDAAEEENIQTIADDLKK